MTERAIVETTDAVKMLLERAVDGQVHVGPPISNDIGNSRVSLFLLHLQPNAELRNEERRAPPPTNNAASSSAEVLDALPLDLRYLITVFRGGGGGSVGEANELLFLGQIISEIHAHPTLTGSSLVGQEVRLTPEAYSMEEMSKIWNLFPDNVYRTSLVYLASPVFVELPVSPTGPPVRKLEQQFGVDITPRSGFK
jgi:hypothetical protein